DARPASIDREAHPMIHALDHVTVAAVSPGAAAQDYASLLGIDTTAAPLQLANVRLDIVAAGPAGQQGLAGLRFAVGDLAKAGGLLARRGLRVHTAEGAREAGRRELYIATDSTHGVPLSLTERAPEGADAARSTAVSGLDHVVIRTPNPE